MKPRIDIPGIGPYQPTDNRDLTAAVAIADFISRLRNDAFCRDTSEGHVTGSAFIVSPERDKCVLMHHTKLDRWLQPGGHCDGSDDVRSVARREAVEETGLDTLRLVSGSVFDVDVHAIPARGAEPAHLHYDIRFLFEADPAAPLLRNEESKDLLWVDLDRLENYTTAPSVLSVRKCRPAQRLE